MVPVLVGPGDGKLASYLVRSPPGGVKSEFSVVPKLLSVRVLLYQDP